MAGVDGAAQTARDELRRRRWRAAAWLAVGLAVLAGCFVTAVGATWRDTELRRTWHRDDGVILAVDRTEDAVVVRFELGGDRREARVDLGDGVEDRHRGQPVTVYVDPADGDHVTIDEGLGDNIGRWIELAIVVGSLAAIGGGVGLSNTYPTAQALRRTVVAPRPA